MNHTHNHEEIRITEFDLFGFTTRHLGETSEETCRWMTKKLSKIPRDVCIHTKIKVKKTLKVLNGLLKHRKNFEVTLGKMFAMKDADNEVVRSFALIAWMMASRIDYKGWFEKIEEQKDKMTDDRYVRNCHHAQLLHLFNQLHAVECVFNHLEIVPENE
jgi:ribosomal protein S10